MEGLMKKIILFRNARKVAEADIMNLFDQYKEAGEKISGVRYLPGGAAQYVNPLAQGFSHTMGFSFESQKAFEAYMADKTVSDINRRACKLFNYPEDILIFNVPATQNCESNLYELAETA